ncbi:MAG: GNAT family N-acetyltransferase [Alphaproteobacteria bacterium]|nr:GNAT family N-acetyltransferase [Alphaproteobacteria bacterium]
MAVVRPAVTTHIPQMIALSHQKRLSYERVQPRFWRHAEGAEEAQTKWFEFLMARGIGIFLVAEVHTKIVGFVRGQLENAPEVYDPGGVTLMIDDFCVQAADLWLTVGKQLLQELKAQAKQKGASQVVVVSGHHDEPKRQFLASQGLGIASEWFLGGVE